jgi:transcriptional regulator with XRE-family HTH domain
VTTSLRRRRKDLDLTQVELAERIGCTQPALSRWELGKNPIRAKRPRRMLEAMFDCEVTELEQRNGPVKDEAATSPRRRSNRYAER